MAEIQALYSIANAETDAPRGDLPPELVRDRDGSVKFDTVVLRDWSRDANGAPKDTWDNLQGPKAGQGE